MQQSLSAITQVIRNNEHVEHGTKFLNTNLKQPYICGGALLSEVKIARMYYNE